jgi:hypothetical protein
MDKELMPPKRYEDKVIATQSDTGELWMRR